MSLNERTQDITAEERETLKRYLLSTHSRFAESLKGLTAEQLAFKPAPDRWSIGGTAEHMALIANVVVQRIMPGLDQAPPPTPDVDCQRADARIRANVPQRTSKLAAPEAFSPAGKWTAAESLQQLGTAHNTLAGLLDTKHNLRGHCIPHPALGLLDGYQWILVTAAHADRHLDQIREVKSDPGYPSASGAD